MFLSGVADSSVTSFDEIQYYLSGPVCLSDTDWLVAGHGW